ncbi:concanavalin A-like lectin/glucanase domain-containing protein [Bisporella sp. PMI_857]|nr:concanavalin A-like lectin/glucanase domain-containing protein [Bisporella sp. PMI_857]
MASLGLDNDLLSSIRVPEPPPMGFDPLMATDELLHKHGLPLRPDEGTDPQRYAKWKHLMSQALTFISPTFEIIQQDLVSSEPAEENEVSSEDAGREHAHKQIANKEGTRWAGAINRELEEGDAFKSVEGSWIVPRAYPLTADWTGSGWKTGKCRSGTWVGIDGYHSNGTSHVIQGGTSQRCTVPSPSETVLQTTHAWVEWIPAPPIAFSNFEVKSGDLVTCIVESPDPFPYDSSTGSDTGRIMLFNRSACTYSTAHLTKVKNKTLSVKGKTAEWIVEASNPKDKNWRDAYLGATFIYDCEAVTKRGVVKNLSDAILTDVVRGGGKNKEKLYIAVKENDTLLGVFTAPTYPVFLKKDNIEH